MIDYSTMVKDIDGDGLFNMFFSYYCLAKDADSENLIRIIKDIPIVKYRDADGNLGYKAASELYFPSAELKEYFGNYPTAQFVAYDFYLERYNSACEDRLKDFLFALGVNKCPRILNREFEIFRSWDSSCYGDPIENRKYDLPFIKVPNYEHRNPDLRSTWKENYIEGCYEIILHIIAENNADCSVALWNRLVDIFESHIQIFYTHYYPYSSASEPVKICSFRLSGTYYWHWYKNWNDENFMANDAYCLANEPWILNNENELVSAKNVTVDTLSSRYDTTSEAAAFLIKYLGIDGNE